MITYLPTLVALAILGTVALCAVALTLYASALALCALVERCADALRGEEITR